MSESHYELKYAGLRSNCTLYRKADNEEIEGFESNLSGAAFQHCLDREINYHTAELQKEITSLQESLADLLAAAEARSEELGKARQLIKNLARTEANTKDAEALMFQVFQLDAQAMQAQWEAAEVETAE